MFVNTCIYFPWYNGVVGLTPYPRCVYDHGIILYYMKFRLDSVYGMTMQDYQPTPVLVRQNVRFG